MSLARADEKAIPVKYLSKLKPSKVKALVNETKLTDKELEKLIADHWFSFRWYQTENMLANSTNFIYFYFLLPTSEEGAKKLIKFYFPGLEISDKDAYVLGVTISALSCMCYAVLFSPTEAAIRSVIKYALRLPASERLHRWKNLFSEDSKTAIFEAIYWSVSSALLYLVNANGGTTIAQAVNSAWLDESSSVHLRRFLTYFFGYISGISFFRNLSDDDFFSALESFLINSKKIPWNVEGLSVRFRRVPLMFNIAAEGLAAWIMRAVVQYPYVSEQSRQLTDGWWFSADTMMALTLVHSIFLYTSSYHRMQGPYNDLFGLMQEEYKEKRLTFKKIEKEVKKIQNREGFFCAFREDGMVIVSTVFWGGIGAVVALNYATPYYIPLASTLLPLLFYVGDQRVAVEKIACREFRKELIQKRQQLADEKGIPFDQNSLLNIPEPSSLRKDFSFGIFLVTGVFLLANALAGASSVSGMVDQSNIVLAACVFIFAMNKEINGAGYFFEKAYDTISDRWDELRDGLSRIRRWCKGDENTFSQRNVIFSPAQVLPAPTLQSALVQPSVRSSGKP